MVVKIEIEKLEYKRDPFYTAQVSYLGVSRIKSLDTIEATLEFVVETTTDFLKEKELPL